MHDPRRQLAGLFFQTGRVAALIGFGVYFDHASRELAPVTEAVSALSADLARERASAEVRQVALWAVDSQDHAGLPFVVVDKARARLFAFDQDGRLRGSTSVLLGSARSDGFTVPATPAGRSWPMPPGRLRSTASYGCTKERPYRCMACLRRRRLGTACSGSPRMIPTTSEFPMARCTCPVTSTAIT